VSSAGELVVTSDDKNVKLRLREAASVSSVTLEAVIILVPHSKRISAVEEHFCWYAGQEPVNAYGQNRNAYEEEDGIDLGNGRRLSR
jgi:hypothetical protein